MAKQTGLLISVASLAEVESALAGGASLIDVKDPRRGPLGRADESLIAAVAAAVAGRCPVSAALGEWAELPEPIACAGLAFVKWGLAGCRAREDWRTTPTLPAGATRVWAAYADARDANAPEVEEVFIQAASTPGAVLLLDTWRKQPSQPSASRPTLLDWCSVAYLEALCERARRAGVRTAFGGSLGLAEIEALRQARPTWFAIRGAACSFNNRDAAICRHRVAELAAAVP